MPATVGAVLDEALVDGVIWGERGRPYTATTRAWTRVRAWADASGVPVSPRGWLSAGVIDQFHAAGR